MDKILQDKEGRNSLAQQCVKELKERYPNFTSSQIAQKVGISQPTFNRIENRQINPSLDTVIKLMSAMGKSFKLSEVLSMQPTEKVMAHNFDTPYMAGNLSEYFASAPYRNIILLALTRSGTTRDEIQTELGNQGTKRLEELLKNGVLTDVRGVIKGRTDEKVTFTQDLLRDALVDCIKHDYDQTKFGTGENWLSFQTESVDKKKAMALIRSKLQKTYSEIRQEILYSSEYYGNDKVFIGMVADSLLKGTNEAEGALQ